LTDAERIVEVHVPLREATVRLLDETTYDAAASDPAFLSAPGGVPLVSWDGRLELALRPFAVARLDGRLRGDRPSA
jgi:hypothetical protein